MTTNPNIEDYTARLLASDDNEEDEEITDEEWAELKAAYQDYLSGHDPGEPLAKVRQELLGHD